jgi:hypothetical protein
VLDGRRDELGVAGAGVDPAEDLVADGRGRDAVADGGDDAGEVAALAGRERRRPALVEEALADRGLAGVMPAARTATRASPGPGTGAGSSRTSSTSRSP